MTGSKAQASRRISAISAVVVAAGAAGAMLAVPSPASAAAAHTTFVGHCSIVGTDSADLRQSFFRGHGICFGSLNGSRAKAHHVVETIRQTGATSPDFFGAPTVHGASQGVGTLVFGGSHCTRIDPCRDLHFEIQETQEQ